MILLPLNEISVLLSTLSLDSLFLLILFVIFYLFIEKVLFSILFIEKFGLTIDIFIFVHILSISTLSFKSFNDK